MRGHVQKEDVHVARVGDNTGLRSPIHSNIIAGTVYDADAAPILKQLHLECHPLTIAVALHTGLYHQHTAADSTHHSFARVAVMRKPASGTERLYLGRIVAVGSQRLLIIAAG